MVWMVGLVLLGLYPVSAVPDIEGYHQPCYAHQRDLNILLLHGISYKFGASKSIKCDPVSPLAASSALYYMEAMRYEIERINQGSDLLPNVSLGFIVMDACHQDLAALSALMYALPDKTDKELFPDDEPITCKNGYKRFTNVIGALGPSQSKQAVMIGGLSTIFQLPLLFPWASTDELSDKTRFTYTARLNPPSKFGAEAMIDLMAALGWNYGSLLYMEGAFGESGAKEVERQAKNKGICLAFSFMFPSDFSDEDVEEAARKLKEYKSARVLIGYILWFHLDKLAPILERYGLSDNFFWIGTDLFPFSSKYGKLIDGALIFDTVVGRNQVYRDYFGTLNPVNRRDNPWFPYFWEQVHDCKWNDSNQNISCQNILEKPHGLEIPEAEGEAILIDGVQVFARSLDQLIKTKCPDAFGNRSKLRSCVNGRDLYGHMLETSFTGFRGNIQFDSKGDLLGKFVFKQFHSFSGESVIVGEWDKSTGSMEIFEENLLWFSSGVNNSQSGVIPEGICSKPCALDEFSIQKELPCCWECRKCRENEIKINNGTDCEVCPIFTWPDENLKFCELIEPDGVKWSSPLSIFLATVTAIGLIVCLIISIMFFKHRNTRLIKASSRELMSIIMVGIALAYITVLFLLAHPSTVICYLERLGFNLSVSVIYVPLMIKTNRIYRIFTGGKQGNQRPRLTSSRAQLTMVLGCLILQIILCVLCAILVPPDPVLQMQVQTVKYVEILCSLPLSGLLPPLCLNLLFILTCAVYGFLTRKLPENFNESWYIFVSVATTTFLWLVFLPAYFTAYYVIYQVVLLCSCLLINATITLLCLYLPKIYCIYYVDENQVKFQTAGTKGTTVGPVGNMNTFNTNSNVMNDAPSVTEN